MDGVPSLYTPQLQILSTPETLCAFQHFMGLRFSIYYHFLQNSNSSSCTTSSGICSYRLHTYSKQNHSYYNRRCEDIQKVNCTLVQALRLCTGCTAHRGSRGIALPFHDHGTRRGEGSASRPGRSLPLGKTRYPFYRRLGGPQGRSGQVRKI